MSNRDREEIMALEKEWAQAFIRNNAEAIGCHIAQDWAIITPEEKMSRA